jgi:hypothetical protein
MLNFGVARHGTWMFARPLLASVVALLLALTGCNGIGNGPEDGPGVTTEVATETLNAGAVNVDQIDEGQYSDLVEGTQEILRDDDAYASFWKRLHADQDSLPERPAVDFEKRVVVAIVLGKRPTGGYGVEIDEVLAEEGGGERRVKFTEAVPGDECFVTQAQTSPYVLATVEAQDEPFTFEGSQETRPC